MPTFLKVCLAAVLLSFMEVVVVVEANRVSEATALHHHTLVVEDPAKPVAEKPAAEKPAADKPAAEKPAAEKPAAEKPAAEKPAAEKPAAEKPEAEKPAAEKPAAEKPAAEKPTAEGDKKGEGKNAAHQGFVHGFVATTMAAAVVVSNL